MMLIEDKETSMAIAPVPKERGIVDPRNQLNDLTAQSGSRKRCLSGGRRALGQATPTRASRRAPAPFSFTDVSRLIRFFTKAGQTVLDPFVGIGSTLKAAALEGRLGIGIELSQTFFDSHSGDSTRRWPAACLGCQNSV